MSAIVRDAAITAVVGISLLLATTSSYAQEPIAPSTQIPAQTVTPELSGTETATVVATPRTTESPVVATATAQPEATPAPILSVHSILAASIVEVTGSGDKPTVTLVELQLNTVIGKDGQVVPGPGAALISLMTAKDGSYAFNDIPAGTHVLWVWGGIGFLNTPSTASNPGLFLSEVTVDDSGVVRGSIPQTIRITEKPPGVMGFPVRSGTGAFRVFEGPVNVRQALAARTATLPGTGVGDGHRSLRWLTLALGLALLGGTGVSWAGARKRRS